MRTQERAIFGTVEVAMAKVVADRRQLLLHLHNGALNKHELGMLIKFLQAKQEELDDV